MAEDLEGDSASKLRLCWLPFSRDHLFGPGLHKALEQTRDRKKAFPERKRNAGGKKFFLSYKQPNQQDRESRPKKHWTGHKGWGRGGILFKPPHAPRKIPMTLGSRWGAFLPQWASVTSSPYILEIIKCGYRLEFSSPPRLEGRITPHSDKPEFPEVSEVEGQDWQRDVSGSTFPPCLVTKDLYKSPCRSTGPAADDGRHCHSIPGQPPFYHQLFSAAGDGPAEVAYSL